MTTNNQECNSEADEQYQCNKALIIWLEHLKFIGITEKEARKEMRVAIDFLVKDVYHH